MGTRQPRCGVRSCKFLRLVPICPQAGDAEKLNVGAVSPVSPVSPSKMRRFQRHRGSVQIWLAIQTGFQSAFVAAGLCGATCWTLDIRREDRLVSTPVFHTIYIPQSKKDLAICTSP